MNDAPRDAAAAALRNIASRLNVPGGEQGVGADDDARIVAMLAATIHDGDFAAHALIGTSGESQLGLRARAALKVLADRLNFIADDWYVQPIRLDSADQARTFWQEGVALARRAGNEDLAARCESRLHRPFPSRHCRINSDAVSRLCQSLANLMSGYLCGYGL